LSFSVSENEESKTTNPSRELQFKEGLHWMMLWVVGAVVTLSSVVFGVSWAVLKGDIQGGFGVSAFMMALLACGIGVMQAFHSWDV
jgi:putative Mn2+ efflux pump MntP